MTMSSFTHSNVPIATTHHHITTFTPPALFSKTNSHRFKISRQNPTHRFKSVSCNVTPNDDHNTLETPKTSPDMQNVDRRNLLLGLGGLYGAAANFTSIPSAFAIPITAPDNLADCVAATSGIHNKADAARTIACCPPILSQNRPQDYVLPQNPVTRIRPPAQRVSNEYVEKYRQAIKAMRDLPQDDPRSFKQQAMIHCAYCNGGYSQKMTGSANKEIQIHNSWLFFPFHRWYLYFYERILGNLIGDESFAIPFWNWDNPTGMMVPPMFEEPYGKGENKSIKDNPIFDAYRDVTHLAPAVIDVDYPNKGNVGASCIDLINSNLSSMYKQMITNATDPISFFGGEYKAGDDPVDGNNQLIGSIERGVHTAMHRWVSDPRMPNNEDMGNFYSAGYDPIFYAHHANVDRMWSVWKDLGIRGHRDPTHDDWLNASYVFYDENKKLVRVYNRDCCDTRRMGYDYELSRIPWARSRPIPRTKNEHVAATARSTRSASNVEDVRFPLKLDKIVKVLVKRPSLKRSNEEKEKANEILFVNGITFDSEKFVKFDVFVNDRDDAPATSAAESEFVGSFTQLPHNHANKMFQTSAVRFVLTELLEDIEAEDDDSILVTLVPRIGCEDAKVSEMKIELVSTA